MASFFLCATAGMPSLLLVSRQSFGRGYVIHYRLLMLHGQGNFWT